MTDLERIRRTDQLQRLDAWCSALSCRVDRWIEHSPEARGAVWALAMVVWIAWVWSLRP